MTNPIALSRRRPTALAALAALAIAAALAGCGGGSSPSVATLGKSHHASGTAGASSSGSSSVGSAGSGSAASAGGAGGAVEVAIGAGGRKAALKFSRCMRVNGVANFPDPGAGGSLQFGSGNGIDPRSPQFQAAMRKCRKDLPTPHFTPAQQAAAKAAALRFSQCMRSHGVTNYPDPQFGSGGQAAVRIGGPGSGLDPSSPSFQRAMQACTSLGLGPKGRPSPGLATTKQ